MSNTINLGDEAKDGITGFSGIVVGITNWLHGCRRIVIQPTELREGKPIDAISFDEPQVVLVRAKAAPAQLSKTGGPRPEPTRHAHSPR